MARREFPAKVKLAAWRRSGGGCEVHIFQSHPDAADIRDQFPLSCDRVAKDCDHIRADSLDGVPVIENAAYLCRECHKIKTDTDKAYMAKRRRHAVDHDKPKAQPKKKQAMSARPFCKRFKKKMNGKVVPRD